MLRHQGVDSGVGTPRVVVEQRELPGAGTLCQRDRALNSRMTEKAQPRQLGRDVLGIGHEQIGVLGQRDGCGVVEAGYVRAGAEGDRVVIGKAGPRTPGS